MSPSTSMSPPPWRNHPVVDRAVGRAGVEGDQGAVRGLPAGRCRPRPGSGRRSPGPGADPGPSAPCGRSPKRGAPWPPRAHVGGAEIPGDVGADQPRPISAPSPSWRSVADPARHRGAVEHGLAVEAHHRPPSDGGHPGSLAGSGRLTAADWARVSASSDLGGRSPLAPPAPLNRQSSAAWTGIGQEGGAGRPG